MEVHPELKGLILEDLVGSDDKIRLRYEIYEVVVGPQAEYFSLKMGKPLSEERWPQERIRQRCAEEPSFRDLFEVITLSEGEAYARVKLSEPGAFRQFYEIKYRFQREELGWKITEKKEVKGIESAH